MPRTRTRQPIQRWRPRADLPLSPGSAHCPPPVGKAGFSCAVSVRGRPVATRESDWDARSRPSALLRGQAFACVRAMSVVFLAAEVERFALLRAFVAPRPLSGLLAVLGPRLPGLGVGRGLVGEK